MPDTLSLISSFTGTPDEPMQYIRSLAYGPDTVLYAADAGGGSIYRIDPDAQVVTVIRSELFSYPYMAGATPDGAVVFSPGRSRVQVIHGDDVSDVAEMPQDIPQQGLLQYAHQSGGRLHVKLVGDEFTGYVGTFRPDGTLHPVTRLPGPSWRRAGFLRSWGDTLLSLSGYRPEIDLILPDGRLDSLRLRGFDSPMISRLRLFESGDIDAPPLITASATALGNHLLVLNMRPGWLQIDVYDRDGRLKAILTQPDPGFNRDYYPTDIAAAAMPASGAIRIAVSVVRPRAQVDVYEWTPSIMPR